MKRISEMLRTPFALCAAVLTIVSSNHALGQISAPDSTPNKSAVDLLREYQSSPSSAPDSEGLLIQILNKRLPSNDENIKAVRISLAKTRAPGEKIMLIKLLASLYVPNTRSRQNMAIETDIRGAIQSSDQRVATEAVMEYSRLGYPPDRYRVLQQAHSTGLLNDDMYYGELAQGLRISGPADQAQAMAELESRPNKYANEVLAATFCTRPLVDQLNRSTQTRLLKLLSEHEPAFPMEIDSFGLVDALRYSFWVNAVANIDSTLNGKPWAQLVMARLLAPSTDPRKILAVFSNPEGKRVLAETKDMAAVHGLLGRAQTYSNTLPQNVVVRSATVIFSSQLKAAETAGNKR